MECLLNFLTENRDEGDEVPDETDQGHGQEQDSLQQEGQHAVYTLIILQHFKKLLRPSLSSHKFTYEMSLYYLQIHFCTHIFLQVPFFPK